jgi:hypothetical protein
MKKASWSILGYPGLGPEMEEIVAFSRFQRNIRLQANDQPSDPPSLYISAIPVRPIPLLFTDDFSENIHSLGFQAWEGGGTPGFVARGYALWSKGKYLNADKCVQVSEHGGIEVWNRSSSTSNGKVFDSWVLKPLDAVVELARLVLKRSPEPIDFFVYLAMGNTSTLTLGDSIGYGAYSSTVPLIELGTCLRGIDEAAWSQSRDEIMKRFRRCFGWAGFDQGAIQ